MDEGYLPSVCPLRPVFTDWGLVKETKDVIECIIKFLEIEGDIHTKP
jgi:hypothetical protein